MGFSVEPIGVIHSCFKDKFGVPRQPGLVSVANAWLELFVPYNRAEAFSGLDGFSHIWITFVFHHCLGQAARLSVRPPRLGGNRKVGVFASRSTHRPNPVGISVAEVAGIEQDKGGLRLRLRGLDLVDGTPVLDIKPYVPYSDSIPEARADYAPQAPATSFDVVFSVEAESQCEKHSQRWPELRQLIVEVLGLDPRPAYLVGRSVEKEFAVRLYELDIHWRVRGEGVIEVISIEHDDKCVFD